MDWCASPAAWHARAERVSRDADACAPVARSLREGYAWAEDKEHCEEYGRMLNGDRSKALFSCTGTEPSM